MSSSLIQVVCASVAQSVEQGTENPRVVGSIPTGSTKCGFSSSGRAPPCQGGGSEFEPRNPLHMYRGNISGVADEVLICSGLFILFIRGENSMRYYFIDYENTDVAGFDGLSLLNENDVVYFYYSESHNRMTLGLHRRILLSKTQFLYRKIQKVEKDALDLELLKELDELIQQKSEAGLKEQYCIISHDKGYEEKIKEFLKKGYKIEICSNIKENNLTDSERLKAERTKLEAEKKALKKEKAEFEKEKKQFQKLVEEFEKQKADFQMMKNADKDNIYKALKNAGLSAKELKNIEPFLELLFENRKNVKELNKILNKALPGRKLKPFLVALENM